MRLSGATLRLWLTVQQNDRHIVEAILQRDDSRIVPQVDRGAHRSDTVVLRNTGMGRVDQGR